MTSREKVYDFMEKAGVLYLSTEDGEKPKIRPIGLLIMATLNTLIPIATSLKTLLSPIKTKDKTLREAV